MDNPSSPDHPILDDPMTFSVWASPDPDELLTAARYLADAGGPHVAQYYQIVKEAVQAGRRVQIRNDLWLSQATAFAAEVPPGFCPGTGVVTES